MIFSNPASLFNSRPHAEVDVSSAHARKFCNAFSTHDLTQRSTIFCNTWLFCHTFQLTTSRRGRPACDPFCQPHPHTFQLTTSRRGRLLETCHFLSPDAFQLTTSRRGRLLNHAPAVKVFIFNSRPHAEVDINISHILCKISILFLIFFTKTTLNKAQKYEYYFIFAKINC